MSFEESEESEEFIAEFFFEFWHFFLVSALFWTSMELSSRIARLKKLLDKQQEACLISPTRASFGNDNASIDQLRETNGRVKVSEQSLPS